MSDRDDTGIVQMDGRHTRSWPACREALGLNFGGPPPVEGVEVDEEGDDDDIEAVTLRFTSPDALHAARERLFDQSEEMFRFGIGWDGRKVQDFAAQLPSPSEVFD